MPLLTTKEIPNGGWVYVQNDATGNPLKKFKSMGVYSAFIKEVLNCRTGNSIPGADIDTVDRDVQAFICAQRGNDPRWCAGNSGPIRMAPEAVYVGPQPGCGFCGGQKA